MRPSVSAHILWHTLQVCRHAWKIYLSPGIALLAECSAGARNIYIYMYTFISFASPTQSADIDGVYLWLILLYTLLIGPENAVPHICVCLCVSVYVWMFVFSKAETTPINTLDTIAVRFGASAMKIDGALSFVVNLYGCVFV